MFNELPAAMEPDDGSGQKAGRRGAVRYLQDEAAPRAARMVLGNALRFCRETAGLSAGRAASQLGGSASKVSRIESGTTCPKERDLLRFFEMYSITDTEQGHLLELAAAAHQLAWWHEWSAVTPKYLQAVVSFEDMATRVMSYEPTYLHGLLQTSEYARALIGRGRSAESTHDVLARFRAQRQERFAEAPDKKLICIVDESALLRPIGSAAIMRRQLEHLMKLMSHPRIKLLLAPLNDYGVHVEIGPTTIFDFAGRLLPTIVYTEGYEGGLVIEDEEMVDRRKKAFDALATRSLDSHAMRRRLQHLADRYK